MLSESGEEEELFEAGLPPRKLKMPGETASEELMALQPSQPLPGVLDFGKAGVGVFPEVEVQLTAPMVVIGIIPDSFF